jgi:hypothetical protein
VVAVIVFGLFGVFLVYLAIHSWRYRVKVRERDSRVRTASAEAASDDPYFEASELESHARGLFVACQEAWDARDMARLSSLVGPDLMVEWERRLDDFESKGWHNRVSVLAPPKIEYVGLVNREDDTEDRAVVRITASLHAYVEDRAGEKIMRKEAKSERIELVEYWTLARSDSSSGSAGWKVVSIEQRAEGDHHLDSEIVASPWSDARLADESLTELAVADGLPPGFTTADLAVVSFEGTVREHALDLSLADARFAPDVLEAAARRVVAAWAEAVDGEDAALLEVATPEAVRTQKRTGKPHILDQDSGECATVRPRALRRRPSAPLARGGSSRSRAAQRRSAGCMGRWALAGRTRPGAVVRHRSRGARSRRAGRGADGRQGPRRNLQPRRARGPAGERLPRRRRRLARSGYGVAGRAWLVGGDAGSLGCR